MKIAKSVSCTRSNQTKCKVCSNDQLMEITLPINQCMRSDGLIINEPLVKLHCKNCGMLMGGNAQIDECYQRSNGNSPFDVARHKNVADGLNRLFKKITNQHTLKVLEIGAASFNTALFLKKLNPAYEIFALERHPESIPDSDAISLICEDFFQCESEKEFDVCYSNQVIEHFDDPVAYLRKAKSTIKDGGFVIACCPTFANVSNELLFSDHLYHFTSEAMSACAVAAGLSLISETVSDWDPFTHVYIFASTMHVKSHSPRYNFDYNNLLEQRISHFNRWLSESNRLNEELRTIEKVTIYGAGEFTQLIRTYIPALWIKIEKIVVDSLEGVRLFDKPVFLIGDISFTDHDVFVIGANKGSHPTITKKLMDRNISPINIFALSV